MTASKDITKDNEEPKKVIQEKTLIEWKAPSRLFEKKDRRFFATVATIIIVLSIPIILVGQFALILVMASIAFFSYVLSSVAPEEAEYKITNKGVLYFKKFYEWEDLKEFFISDHKGQKILNIGTRKIYPGRLFMMLDKKVEDAVKDLVSDYLPFIESPKTTYVDKISHFASKYLSLE